MLCLGHIMPNLPAPIVQLVVVAVGCLLLYVAVKVGYVVLKIVLGLAALALLGGAIWWFVSTLHY